ncbi:aromatic amino acid exporter YddG [Humitalea sp. 24SJ18S-53]|uniref:aromatic amino acid exporter YddG n=1 Tax=Humitalea sp. 24SJ18S-53 TaxID=3422307 RepID=UPI003D67DA89
MKPATLAGTGALALWAFLALLGAWAAPLPPLQVTALAFAVGGAVGIVVLAARKSLGALRQPPLAWVHGVGGLFGYHALYFAAIAWAPPVTANLLNYLWPLLIVLLSAPVLGMRLSARHFFGTGLGFLGCAVLIGAGATLPVGSGLGLVCAVAAAVVWAVYSVTSRRMAAVPTEAVAGFCLGTALLAGGAHLAFETWMPPSAAQWGAVVLLGLGPVGAAFFLWDVGMKRGDPRLLGALAYAVPLASTLLLVASGAAVFDARIGAAALLIAGGGFLASGASRA